MNNDLVQGLKAAKATTGSGRKKYSLDETLYILDLINNNQELSAKEVADMIPDRTVHSIRYRFFENPITNAKGETVTRSFRKYNTVEEIYAHFKVEVPEDLETDVAERIASYGETLTAAAV